MEKNKEKESSIIQSCDISKKNTEKTAGRLMEYIKKIKSKKTEGVEK